MENTNEELLSWDYEEPKPEGRYFKPELGKKYIIVISSARKIKKAFKPEDVPKVCVDLAIMSIDGVTCMREGKPYPKEWTTGAWNIVKEVSELAKSKRLFGAKFMVKKYNEGTKYKFLFETIEPGKDDGSIEAHV